MQNENEPNPDDEKITVTASKRMFNKGFRIVDNESDSESIYSDDSESDYSDDSDEEFDDDDVEVWMDIPKYDNYMISSFGNVYSIQTGRILKPGLDSNGYQMVSLCKNGKGKSINLHKLVANAFIPNPDNKKCIDHIDNDRKNNYVSNLRYATNQENNRNASKKKNNTSGVIGVSYCKIYKKWRAFISINGKIKHLGYFQTLEQAKEARIQAVNKYYGDFTHKSQKRI